MPQPEVRCRNCAHAEKITDAASPGTSYICRRFPPTPQVIPMNPGPVLKFFQPQLSESDAARFYCGEFETIKNLPALDRTPSPR